jgi:hypothetical protein
MVIKDYERLKRVGNGSKGLRGVQIKRKCLKNNENSRKWAVGLNNGRQVSETSVGVQGHVQVFEDD